MYKEEWDVLEEEMRKINQCDLEKFGTLFIYSSESVNAILGGRWWPQAAAQEGDNIAKRLYVIYGNKVMSAPLLEVSLLGVGTVLRVERDAWSI